MKTLKSVLILTVVLLSTIRVYSQAELNIKDITICRGQKKNISIEMMNSVDIRAFQLHIVLPKNVRIVEKPEVSKERVGMYLDEFGDMVQSTIMLNYRLKDDGSIIIVVNSTDATPFLGDKGAVVNLTIEVDEMAELRSDIIEIKEVELVYADGCTYVSPADKVCKIDIRDSVTSVKELKKVIDGPVDVYSIDGILVMECVPVVNLEKSLKSGVYIVDGFKLVIK